ncbi:MAG: 2'-5' RNA ligase family protein [Cyclobacteriaceae bacterium]
MTESLYFIAILPDPPVYDRVMAFKEEVASLFGSKAALRSPPHITLHMPFKWKESKEHLLRQKLAGFSFEHYPFNIGLGGFGAFPPRVIFVDVIQNEALKSLQKQLVRHMRTQLNVFNADYKDKPFHPHMTIAFRDLKKARFKEAWDHFESIEYEAAFPVKGFHLLKHDGKRWNEFEFFEG